MANHAPAAASVLKSASGVPREVTSGVAVPAGDVVYLDTANSSVAKLAKCNGTLLEATVAGIAANTVSAAGQPLTIITQDELFAGGFTLASGAPVYLSATAGKMCPLADLVSTNYTVQIGIGKGSNKLVLKPVQGGQIP